MRHLICGFMVLSALTLGACSDDGSDTTLDATVDAPLDAGNGDDASADAGGDATVVPTCGAIGFMGDCGGGGDCGGCMCHTYGMGDVMLCTISCEVPEDCPAPSTGCSNMGVCKKP